MENQLTCSILTPDKKVYEGEVNFAVVPAYDGEMGFLLNHAPLISELDVGEVRLDAKGGVEYLLILGGIVEIKDNQIVILTENALTKDDLSREELQKELEVFLRREIPKDPQERKKYEFEFKRLQAGLKISSR